MKKLLSKQSKLTKQLTELREQAGEVSLATVEDQTKVIEKMMTTNSSNTKNDKEKAQVHKVHHEYLMKEMLWMQDDFERERKKKQSDAKKQVRICRKELSERLIRKEKQMKD